MGCPAHFFEQKCTPPRKLLETYQKILEVHLRIEKNRYGRRDRAGNIPQVVGLGPATRAGASTKVGISAFSLSSPRCMSIFVMQIQHSLETSTSPIRQCGSPQATKLDNKVSGVTRAYSFNCSHTGHCHCPLSNQLISRVRLRLERALGASHRIL